MVIWDLELWCLSSETVPWPSDLWRAFFPFMNQVQKCSYKVLKPTTKVYGEKQSLAINQLRQCLGKSILTRLRMGRKIEFACLLLYHLCLGFSYLLQSLISLPNYPRQIYQENYLRQFSLCLLSHHLQKTWCGSNDSAISQCSDHSPLS